MNPSVLPSWVGELRDQIPLILRSHLAGKPGEYRLCVAGDLLPPRPGAGLGFSCYAAKAALQCGLWQDFSPGDRSRWAQRIRSFQTGPRGLFVDPWIERHQARRELRHRAKLALRGRWDELCRTWGVDWTLRIAETRQALSTLWAMGEQPDGPIVALPCPVRDIHHFLDGLDWNRPWGAGAQTGHLLFLLKHATLPESQREQGLRDVLAFLDSIECPRRGGWHRGEVRPIDILNGAMKVTSGLAWWELPVRHSEALLATALADVTADYDCGHTNRLFVLHRLAQQTTIPRDALRAVLLSAMESLEPFRRADSGFSSTVSGSLTEYYGTPVSRGLAVGDLHGLCLLTWAVALAASLNGELDTAGWRLVAP